MSAPSDPKRWTAPDAEVPAGLAQLLHGARDELGSANEVSELARRLSSALGPAAGLTRDPAPDAFAEPQVPSGTRGVGRLGARGVGRTLAWTAAGASTIAAAWFVASSLAEPGASARPPALPAPAIAPAVPGAPAAAPGVPAPKAMDTAAPELAKPPEQAATRSAAARPNDRDRASSAKSLKQDHPSPGSRATRRSPAARPSQTLAEATLLDQARAALEADPDRALKLTRDHQRRFPHGALAEEREAIATLALKRLGRHEAARERAAAFERRYRSSVHRPRLDLSTDAAKATNAKAAKDSRAAQDSANTSSPREGDVDTARGTR